MSIYYFSNIFLHLIYFYFLCRIHLDPKPLSENPMLSTVLIVEDETILAVALKSMLQSFGLNVIGTARTSEDAVAKTLSFHPDLIVMDINLADEKTGLDAAEEIRCFSNTPIVFQSATQEENLISRARKLEHSTLLPKTLSPLDWMNAILPYREEMMQVA